MQITRLYATNFLSYEVLDLPLADRGLVLIDGENQDTGGSNGAGKSAIFEALVWGLFGSTNRGLKADEVIRLDEDRQPVNETMVCVEIDVDGKHVQAFRHRNHSQHKNKLLLFIDGNEITMGTDKETQERLHSLLQIDRESFISAVMFPQGAEGFASLTDSGQKAILDRILGTERFAEAQVRVREKLKKLSSALTRAESTTASAQRSYQDAENQVRDIGARLTAWEADHAARRRAIEAAITRLEVEKPAVDASLEAKVKTLKAESESDDQTKLAEAYREATRKASEASKALEQARGRAATLQSQHLPLGPEPPAAASSVEDAHENAVQWNNVGYDAHGERVSLSTKLATLNQQLENVLDTCPTCGQPLPEEVWHQTRQKLFCQIDALEKQRPELDAKIEEARRNFEAWQAESDKAREHAEWVRLREVQVKSAEAIAKALADVNRLALEIVPLESEALQLQQKHDAIIAKVRELQEASTAFSVQVASLNNWNTKAAQFEGAKIALESEKNPYPEMLTQQREQLQKLDSEIARAQVLQDALTTEVRHLTFWDQGFGNTGVKSLLLDTVVPFLTNRTNEYLGMLTNDMATVEFQTQTTLGSGETRDKFRIDINFMCGGDSYASVSGGERRRVDLAALFALGDLAASRSLAPIKLRLLDEPFDNLDTLGSEQVVQILREKVLPSSGTVLVMTHDDNLKALIENRITVVKENGISRILGG